MTDLKKLLEDQENQAKQIEASYHQIIGGINMLKYLVEREATDVEDITQYKIQVDGEKVEVIPDETWKVADIKLWLDAQGISYTSSALKADLLALI